MQSRDAGLSPRRRAALRESPHKSKSAPPSSGGLGVVGLAAAAVAAIAAVGVGYLMKNNHKAKPKRNEKPAVKRKLKTRRGTSSAGSSLRSRYVKFFSLCRPSLSSVPSHTLCPISPIALLVLQLHPQQNPLQQRRKVLPPLIDLSYLQDDRRLLASPV